MKTAFYKHIELDSELEEIKSLLEKNDIQYEVSSADVIIDETIVGSAMFAKYTLKLLPEDFTQANTIIRENTAKKGIQIEDYQHLAELSDEELFDILENPSEWSTESEIVARKILQSRDINVSEDQLLKIKEDKNRQLKHGKSVPIGIQVLYFLAIIIGFYITIAFMLAGIGMGYYYAYGMRTDNYGEKIYVYDERARKIGRLILYGGIICFFIQLYILFNVDLF